MTKYPCHKTAFAQNIKTTNKLKHKQGHVDLVAKIQNPTNLGLESLVAKADGAFLVIAHNVSAALALTSGGFWFT